MGKRFGLFGLASGILTGVALGVLFAPKSGKETRADLKKKLDELAAKVKNIDAEDVKEYVNNAIENIREQIDDLSMEKVGKIAKKKAKDLKDSVEKLAKYVKKKGTPVLEEAVEQVRLKAIDVTEGVLNKLEGAEKKPKKIKAN